MAPSKKALLPVAVFRGFTGSGSQLLVLDSSSQTLILILKACVYKNSKKPVFFNTALIFL
jgi:hypothetical protein